MKRLCTQYIKDPTFLFYIDNINDFIIAAIIKLVLDKKDDFNTFLEKGYTSYSLFKMIDKKYKILHIAPFRNLITDFKKDNDVIDCVERFLTGDIRIKYIKHITENFDINFDCKNTRVPLFQVYIKTNSKITTYNKFKSQLDDIFRLYNDYTEYRFLDFNSPITSIEVDTYSTLEKVDVDELIYTVYVDIHKNRQPFYISNLYTDEKEMIKKELKEKPLCKDNIDESCLYIARKLYKKYRSNIHDSITSYIQSNNSKG